MFFVSRMLAMELDNIKRLNLVKVVFQSFWNRGCVLDREDRASAFHLVAQSSTFIMGDFFAIF